MLDLVDKEVHRISAECLAEARRLLRENREKLDAIAMQLLIHETLDEPAVYAAADIARPAPAEKAAGGPHHDAGAGDEAEARPPEGAVSEERRGTG